MVINGFWYLIYCGAMDHDQPYGSNHWQMGIVPLGSLTATPLAKDSTSNANDGTVNGGAMQRPAVLGTGTNFRTANSQNINVGNGAALNITGDMTVSAWVQLQSGVAGARILVGKDKDSGGRAFDLDVSTDGTFGNNCPRFYINGGGANDANGSNMIGSDVMLTVGAWAYVCGVYQATGTFDMYVNGVSTRTQRTGGLTSIPVAAANVRIGSREYSGFEGYADAKLDEVRISSVARSAQWIHTEYNNQDDPGRFVTLGAEIPPP